MNIFKKLSLAMMTNMLFFLSHSTFAGYIANPGTCSVNNVSLNSIQSVIDTSATQLLSQSYAATSCIGIYGDNDDASGLNSPDVNIGQLGDGLLNGEDILNGMEFITAADLQALDADGIKNDPGWIHLAHFDADDADDDNNGVSYSNVGPVPGGSATLDISDLLSFTLECISGDLSDCDSMTWTLATKLTIIDDVQALLGAATFDHLAFSIKAGNQHSGGGWAVYDFNFHDIYASEANPLLDFNTPYILAGTLNTGDFGSKGVSHMNVWARDPANDPTQVPEPATLFIFALCLLSLSLRRLTVGKKRNK